MCVCVCHIYIYNPNMFQRLPFRLTVTTNAIFPRCSSPYSDHCFTKSCV